MFHVKPPICDKWMGGILCRKKGASLRNAVDKVNKRFI
ncbi:unknown [Eggerthella sp. CAG:209]|nr:unknown [Eggerthella sp. CAG:209]